MDLDFIPFTTTRPRHDLSRPECAPGLFGGAAVPPLLAEPIDAGANIANVF